MQDKVTGAVVVNTPSSMSGMTFQPSWDAAHRMLGIHSRAELGRAMAEREQAVET